MKVIFEMPVAYRIAYADITTQCGDLCDCEEKENLSGDQIIAIIAIAAPIVWELVTKYLPDPQITIEFQLDEQTTITVSERSVKRAKMKGERIKAEWEKTNKKY